MYLFWLRVRCCRVQRQHAALVGLWLHENSGRQCFIHCLSPSRLLWREQNGTPRKSACLENNSKSKLITSKIIVLLFQVASQYHRKQFRFPFTPLLVPRSPNLVVRCNTSALQLHSHTVKFTDKVLGLFDGLLKVQIAAPARDGLANEELLTFLSEVLSFSFSSLFLLSLSFSLLSLFYLSLVCIFRPCTRSHMNTQPNIPTNTQPYQTNIQPPVHTHTSLKFLFQRHLRLPIKLPLFSYHCEWMAGYRLALSLAFLLLSHETKLLFNHFLISLRTLVHVNQMVAKTAVKTPQLSCCWISSLDKWRATWSVVWNPLATPSLRGFHVICYIKPSTIPLSKYYGCPELALSSCNNARPSSPLYSLSLSPPLFPFSPFAQTETVWLLRWCLNWRLL